VPLFVEEMTKAILESGYLKETDGHYELVGSLSTFAIPATLQDSLMARLDRLVTAKAVAQYAAVIGRQFSYALLQAVSQLGLSGNFRSAQLPDFPSKQGVS
jgi:predicted ATPase